MALSYLTKANIRRHLRLPFAGSPFSGQTQGIRAITKAGQLELYMNLLQAEEEAILLGKPYGTILLIGPYVAGQTVIVTINSTPLTYIITPQDMASKIPSQVIAANVALMINNATLGPTASTGLYTGSDLNLAFAAQPTPAQVTIAYNVTFTLATSGTASTIVEANGQVYPPPTFVIDDSNPNAIILAHGILPICDALEQQVVNASPNLSFSDVGSTATGRATFRPDELQVRQALYKSYVYQLGVMLSYYPPPYSGSGIGSFGIQV